MRYPRLVLLAIVAAELSIPCAHAQDEVQTDVVDDKPAVTDRQKIVIVKKQDRDEKVNGVKVGDFTLFPSISFIEYYDDNIYAEDSNTRDDFVTVVVPAINIESNWKEDSLKVSAGGELSRYSDYSSENTNDYWLDVAGKIDIDRGKNLFAAAGYERKHEDRASPESAFGEEPTRYGIKTANAGYEGWSGDHQFKIAYTLSRYDFMDVSSQGGVISSDDRDRDEHGVGVRYLYHYSDEIYPYVQILTDRRDYSRDTDFEGYDRDSDGVRADIGVNIHRENMTSKLYVGTLERDYSDANFADPSETDYGLSHSWRTSKKFQLLFKLSRSIQETTLSGSPGYLVTDSSVRWRQQFGERNLIQAVYARADVDYYQITREDSYENYVLGYSRKVIDDLFLNIDIQHGTRDSNVGGDDYTINQIYLRIKSVI